MNIREIMRKLYIQAGEELWRTLDQQGEHAMMYEYSRKRVLELTQFMDICAHNGLIITYPDLDTWRFGYDRGD